MFDASVESGGFFCLGALLSVTLLSPLPSKSAEAQATTAMTTATATATATANPTTVPVAPISLEEAYHAALEKTETAQIAGNRVDQADARVAQARGRLLPKLSASASYLRQEDVGARAAIRDTYRPDQSSGRLTLTQPLYSGGLLLSNVSAARSERESSRQEALVARVNLFNDVARAFFDVRANEEDAKNLEASINLTAERVAELQRRARIGRSRSGEVLMAQSQLAVLQSQAEAIRSATEIARDRFSFITGLDRASHVAPSTTSSLADNFTKPEPLEMYLDLIEKRPDLAALSARLEAARADVRAARSGHLPSLHLTGNSYLFRTGGGQDIDWDIGVGLTIPIYEGGVVQGRIREAKDVETEITLTLSRLKREAETQVRAAYHALSGAIDQAESLKKAFATAERNYREQTRDYGFGLVTNLDVLQALTTFQDTKRAYDRTRIQVDLLRAELDATVARIP
jgi:outer membrane protein TolC